ncbi:cation-transporting P-type ATPase, partial [Streptomyces sp. SID13726]|nr:cation-transporting P-type ATPase [Streptomyces sp. SID13726]
ALVEGVSQHAASLDLADRDARRRACFRFNPRLRRMSVILDGEHGTLRVIVKGAPEAVLPLLAEGEPAGEAQDAADALAADGMRGLAVAVRELPPGSEAVVPRRQDVERDLHLLGLVGLYDPPRPEVAAAVRRCHEA